MSNNELTIVPPLTTDFHLTSTPPVCALSNEQAQSIVDQHLQTVVLPQLSAQFSTGLIQQYTQNTVNTILSSLQAVQEKLTSALSASSFHPYEKYKQMYLKPIKHIIPTFNELSIPQNFNLKTLTNQITSIGERFDQRALSQVAYLTANPEAFHQEDVTSFCNAFASLSGDKFVVDQQAIANHFQFLETVTQIDLDDVEKNPVEAAQKILAYYVQMYK